MRKLFDGFGWDGVLLIMASISVLLGHTLQAIYLILVLIYVEL